MEQLLQLDSRSQSGSSAGSSAASSPTRLSGFTGMNMGMGISPVALSQLRSLFPDIVPEETTADQSSHTTNVEDNNNEEDVDGEEDGWVYGDVILRGDLPEQLVERLRQAVHDALSPPRALLTSPITSTTTSFTTYERSKPLSHRAKPSDLPSWRASATTMGSTNTNTRTRQPNHYSPPLSSNSTYSYQDRHNFAVNLFNKANALHPQSPKRMGGGGADSDNWRSRESRVSSWRNTNVKWNESTSSYVPVRV
jgi:hypothetical protein